MKDKILLDSNILIYAFDTAEKEKHEKAKNILKKCLVGKEEFAVSVQNLSEFFVNITKKISNPVNAKDAESIIEKLILFDGLKKLDINKEVVLKAIKLSEKYNVSYWDSLIASAMFLNGINKIYTENTKDFSKIEGIIAKNPFI